MLEIDYEGKYHKTKTFIVCGECKKEVTFNIDPRKFWIDEPGDGKCIMLEGHFICPHCGYDHDFNLEIDTDDVN